MKKILFNSIILILTISIHAQGLKIGNTAPNFNLKSTGDKMLSLENFSNEKGLIVIFTCNHCPYSVAYEDRIIAIDKKYKEKGYPVVAINPNDPISYPEDSFEAMKVRAQEKGFSFPYLMDAKQEIYPQYGATKTPHVYVLKNTKEGFKVAYIGAVDNNSRDAAGVTENYLTNALDDLLAGKTPQVKTTKAIGCSIKPKKKN